MKILWLVNIAFPPMLARMGLSLRGSGWWMVELANRLARDPDVDLTVAHCDPSYRREEQFRADNVRFWMLPMRDVRFRSRRANATLAQLAAKINDMAPDIVSIRGTERFYGLVTPFISTPVAIDMQGIANAVKRVAFGTGGLGLYLLRIVRRPMDLKYAVAAARAWRNLQNSSRNELRIYQCNEFFVGRTDWQREVAQQLSPGLRAYFTVPRAHRPAFFERQWSLEQVERHRLFTCGRCVPYRAFDELIQVVARHRERFPDIRLRIAGDCGQFGWGGYLRRLAGRLGVAGRVEFLGFLNDEQLADELSVAHMYVHPSYADTSANSLSEAMCVGTPCIASDVGGIPTILGGQEHGLMYRAGDVGMLAEHVATLLTNEGLACRVGQRAREFALPRHEPANVARKELEVYREVIRLSQR